MAEPPSESEVGPVDDGPAEAPAEAHYEAAQEAGMRVTKELLGTKPPPAMPALQREATTPATKATFPATKAAAPATKAAEPYMVPTEIGDLPSDLWTLLGEQPPPPVTKETPAQASAADGEVQRKANGQPARMLTEVFQAPEIQRVEEAPALQATAAEQAEEAVGEESIEIDLDLLARDVYTEIRRRLQIDWERGRFR